MMQAVGSAKLVFLAWLVGGLLSFFGALTYAELGAMKPEAGGEYVTRQLDRIWTKYTGNPPPYGLRDPKIDEKRVLFICRIDRIATFGKP